MDRRDLLAALAGGAATALAGCSTGEDRPTPTDAPPETTRTPETELLLPTESPRPPTEPTERETATPTSSPTPALTATPPTTATADEREVVADVGEWAGTQTTSTRLEVRVERVRTRSSMPADTLRGDHRDEAPIRPPSGETWVDVAVAFRNRGDDEVRLAASTWSLVDLRDEVRTPDAEAMEKALDTLGEDVPLGPFDGHAARLVFATPYPSDLVVETVVGEDGATLRWVA